MLKFLISPLIFAHAFSAIGNLWSESTLAKKGSIEFIDENGEVYTHAHSTETTRPTEKQLFLTTTSIAAKLNHSTLSTKLYFTNVYQHSFESKPWLVTHQPMALKTANSHTLANTAVINLKNQQGLFANSVESTFFLSQTDTETKGASQQSPSAQVTPSLNTTADIITPSIAPLTQEQLNRLPTRLEALNSQIKNNQKQTQRHLKSNAKTSVVINQQYKAFHQKSSTISSKLPKRDDGELLFSEEEKPNTEKIIIKADSLYFDARKEVNVYQGNISVQHPDYNLTATKKLKVFLSKNKEGQNDITQIIASGDVFLERINKLGKTQRAKAEIIEYDLQKEEIYLVNGYPALEKEGEGTMQARKENVWMRLYADGSLITSPDGAWEIIYTNLQRD